MDNNNNSGGEGGGNKKRKSDDDDISDNNNNSNSITSAATHLHSLLIAKEKELKEKEEEFDRRVNSMNLSTRPLVLIRIFYS